MDGDTLSVLICGLAKEDDHFLEEPIALTNCGHYVCKKCLSPDLKQKITCKCGAITEKDFKEDKESVAVKQMIKMCLDNISTEVARKTTNQIKELKGTF